jgi:hypothetical protein
MRCASHVRYPADDRVQLLDEDRAQPLQFASHIGRVLSHQTIVLVSCSTSPKMFPDMDYFHQHFALSPHEIVEVSGMAELRMYMSNDQTCRM